MAVSNTKSTAEVMADHNNAFGGGDLQGLLDCYADDAVVMTADRVIRGKDELAAFFANSLETFPPGTEWTIIGGQLEGDVASSYWAAKTATGGTPFGAETFIIKDGKITLETSAWYGGSS